MYFERFFDKGLAQAGYLIGCQQRGEAIVVDPLRDIDRYLEAAKREEMEIRYVCETHIHADFLSGARQLAESTGAKLLLSEEGGEGWIPRFEHTPLRDGDEIELGNVLIRVLHTPGHTPEHLSYLVIDRATGEEPVMILTGDFVFVGDVGRPDLLENAAGVAGSADESARRLFASTRTVRSLPDFVQIWPGHGAGSACGKALGALPSTTIGYERRFNWALREESEESFVKTVLTGQPEVPSYFGRMKRINRDGPTAFESEVDVPRLELQALDAAIREGARVVDARSTERFAQGHIPGALNIPDDSSFSNWAGWLLDPDQDHLLVADRSRIDELRRELGRVGVDRVIGYIEEPGIWARDGRELETTNTLCAKEFFNQWQNREALVVDVRTREEYEQGHLPGAAHIHLGRLSAATDSFDSSKPLVVYCEAGGRSGIASSILLSHGITQVTNVADGFAAWRTIEGAPVDLSEVGSTPR